MKKKNILIVDDSALMRRVESDIINSDERFQVADMVTNGLEAFDLVTRNVNQYDAVVLDINMPRMSGLEFLEAVSHAKLKLKVIIVSTLAKEGAAETIRALELGAFDYVTKPDSFVDAMSDSFQSKLLICLQYATELVRDEVSDLFRTPQEVQRKVQTAPETKSEQRSGLKPDGRTTAEPVMPVRREPKPQPARPSPVAGQVSPMNPRAILAGQFAPKRPHRAVSGAAKRLVLIASSTGGPKALQQVICKLPKRLNAPVLIVQHMSEGFTKSLANRLDEQSEVHVIEVQGGEKLEKGTVYLARGGSQMRLKKAAGGYVIEVDAAEPPRNGLKPCADIMFESVAALDFDDIVCVVLTGMGGDGTMGIRQLNERNNIYVIAQDEPTSTVYGMPKVVYEAGLTDVVRPLDEIAEEIIKNVGVQ